MAFLKKKFDKPRDMHKQYIKDVTSLGPIAPTSAAIDKFADILRDSTDGIEASKQTDVTFIFTSIAVDLTVKNRGIYNLGVGVYVRKGCTF